MGTDTLKPMTKEWFARQRRHRHNSYSGHARMMQMQTQAIMPSDTCTDEAKIIACNINNLASLLSLALKQRIDL